MESSSFRKKRRYSYWFLSIVYHFQSTFFASTTKYIIVEEFASLCHLSPARNVQNRVCFNSCISTTSAAVIACFAPLILFPPISHSAHHSLLWFSFSHLSPARHKSIDERQIWSGTERIVHRYNDRYIFYMFVPLTYVNIIYLIGMIDDLRRAELRKFFASGIFCCLVVYKIIAFVSWFS